MSTQLWDYGPPLLSSYPQISKHALASHPVVTCNHFEKATWDQQIFGLYGLQIIHSHHSQRFGRRRKKHGAWPSHKNDAGVWCCVPADSSLISPQILGIDQAQLFSQLLRRAVKWWLVGGYSTWRLYNLYQCWYPYLLLVFLSSLRFLSWLFWITPRLPHRLLQHLVYTKPTPRGRCEVIIFSQSQLNGCGGNRL
jgi:hypothetical protein